MVRNFLMIVLDVLALIYIFQKLDRTGEYRCHGHFTTILVFEVDLHRESDSTTKTITEVNSK